VWTGWLPCTTALAIAGVALGLGLPAVGAFLVVYNLGHVALRWWALRAGWAYGLRVGSALHQPLLQRAAAWSGPAMALAVGLALPLAARYLAAPFPTGARAVLAGLAATGTALLVWRRGQLDGLRFGLLLLVAALVVGQAWR